MTCADGEDYEYEREAGFLTKGARRLSDLIASNLARRCTHILPKDLREAMATLFLTAANTLSS